jgi:hypothetical protein
MRRLRRRLCATWICVLASFGSTAATAADLKFSGFATAGYAVSDQDFRYLRYIDNDGTFKVDSLAGVQAEAQFNPQWGATLQVVGSAPRTRDNGMEAKIRWGFISFRPDNDWLFRVGRLRPPFLIHSQNAEVGVTYDQARLPQEVYSLSPVYDFDGGAVTKTWPLENAEISLDAYWGKTDLKFRFPRRDAAEVYIPQKVRAKGLILSHTTDSLLLRGGANRAIIEFGDGLMVPATFIPTPIPFPPPIGGTLYVPGTLFSKLDVTVLTLGADWRAGDWRVTGEYGKRILKDVNLGLGGHSAYVTLARQIGKWTPYVSHARLRSDSDTRGLYEAVNGTPVPLAAQLFPPFPPATFHRLLADQLAVFDQYSTMLGASYSFSATSKLKLEAMRTKVGVASALVDGDVHNKSFNVFSVSYSVAF